MVWENGSVSTMFALHAQGPEFNGQIHIKDTHNSRAGEVETDGTQSLLTVKATSRLGQLQTGERACLTKRKRKLWTPTERESWHSGLPSGLHVHITYPASTSTHIYLHTRVHISTHERTYRNGFLFFPLLVNYSLVSHPPPLCFHSWVQMPGMVRQTHPREPQWVSPGTRGEQPAPQG